MRALLLCALALTGCSNFCSPLSGPASDVCVTSNQRVGADQAFSLRATTYAGNGGVAVCTTEFDGGTLTLRLDGNLCDGSISQPVARAITADCSVGPLPAGTYTFSNLGVELTLYDGGFGLDGGELRTCP